jgi:hypothetical protein
VRLFPDGISIGSGVGSTEVDFFSFKSFGILAFEARHLREGTGVKESYDD